MTNPTRLLYLAAAMAVLLPLSLAQAADLPMKHPYYKAPAPFVPYFNWTGFYVGLNAGYGFGSSEHSFTSAGTTTGNYSVSGPVAGATLGYNWQFGSYVLGGEADFDWSDIHGSTSCPNPAFTCKTSNDWLGTARARFGYAFDRWLPYLTAGAAFGSVKAEVAGFGGTSSTRIGWTAGAGVEYAPWDRWTVKFEYLYADLGSFNCTGCTAVPPDDVKFNTSLVRAGVNYRF